MNNQHYLVEYNANDNRVVRAILYHNSKGWATSSEQSCRLQEDGSEWTHTLTHKGNGYVNWEVTFHKGLHPKHIGDPYVFKDREAAIVWATSNL